MGYAGTLAPEQKREVSGACPECLLIGLNPVRASALAVPFLPSSLNCPSAELSSPSSRLQHLPVSCAGQEEARTKA